MKYGSALVCFGFAVLNVFMALQPTTALDWLSWFSAGFCVATGIVVLSRK